MGDSPGFIAEMCIGTLNLVNKKVSGPPFLSRPARKFRSMIPCRAAGMSYKGTHCCCHAQHVSESLVDLMAALAVPAWEYA